MTRTPRTERDTSCCHRLLAWITLRRIMSIILGLCLITISIVASIQLHVIHTYNQATSNLHQHIQAAGQPQTDLTTLHIQQQYTDAQLQYAHHFAFLLLPTMNTAIEHNQAVSATLTQRIEDALRKQQEERSSSTSSHSSASSSSQNSQQSNNTATNKDKLNQVLQFNQQFTGSNNASTSQQSSQHNTTTKNNARYKPW